MALADRLGRKRAAVLTPSHRENQTAERRSKKTSSPLFQKALRETMAGRG